MRKTLNINLGGLAFIIDENAYELLHNYLETLRRKFGNDAEREEIMSDIESRIAEMLQQKLANRKEVVGIEEVQPVIEMMGRPEDIAGEETTSTSSATTTTVPGSTINGPVKRRLYRDPDDAVVGGVISGLCHYFGINDPIWIRVAWAALVFMSVGSVILIYLLLLIIVPKANTAAEKLQMRGEPINISTIEKEVRDAATRAGDSINQMVGGGGNFFERAWAALVTVLRALAKVIAVVCIIFAVCWLAFVGFTFAGFYFIGSSSLSSASHFLADSPSTISLFSFGYLLFFAVPLIGLIYLALRALLGRRTQVRWLKWGLLATWFLGIILLGIAGAKTGIAFSTTGTKRDQATLVQPANGILYAQLVDSAGRKISVDEYDQSDFSEQMFDAIFRGVEFGEWNRMPINKPNLELIASDNDSFYIQRVTNSQGRTKRDAEKNAESVSYPYTQIDSVLNLNPYIYIERNGKWRAQNMKLRIAIPAGKKIRFANNIDIWHAIVKGDSKYDDTEFANTLWTVEGGKVKCIEGENHTNSDNEDTVKNGHGHVNVHVDVDDDNDKDDKKSNQDF